MDEVIGWLSSATLVLTISAQLRKQWRSQNPQGVSKWLFIGQIVASLGFVYYSVRADNWVFVVTNSVLGVEAGLGLALLLLQRRKLRRDARGSARAQDEVRGRKPVSAAVRT